MQATTTVLEAASARQMAVMRGALTLLAELPNDPCLEPEANITSALDGLVGAIAMIAEGSGMCPDKRSKRFLADNVRTALLKSMREVRTGGLMGAANDTTN